MPNDERILETMPTGTLGLVATDSCIGLAQKVDAYLQGWREHREHQQLTRVLSRTTTKTATLSSLLHLDSVPARLNVLSTSLFVVMICTSW